MKNNLKYLPLLMLCFLSFFSCKKEKEVMPDYTMTGTNTFGAYVNGKLWLPKGRPGFAVPRYSVHFDPSYKGGKLEIDAYREINEKEQIYESMALDASGVDHEGVYYWGSPFLAAFISENCDYVKDTSSTTTGWLEVTKLDLQNGIIAGKFEFTLIEPGCETIRVTGGRFDKKLY